MKRHSLFVFWMLLVLCFGLTGCNMEGKRTLHIDDQADILSPEDSSRLSAFFHNGSYDEVYLFTVPDSMSYAEAMDYKSPQDRVPWSDRLYTYRIYYFSEMHWVKVSIPSYRENDFNRKGSLHLYHIQHDLNQYSDPMEDVFIPLLTDITELSSERVSRFATASSVLSVVEYLNEALILPSNNFLHVMIFRAPLWLALTWIHVFKGAGWPILCMLLLLIGLSVAQHITKKHVRLYGVLYVFHLLAFICLVFCTVPSYDTTYLVAEMGFTKAAAVLDTTYLNMESMGSSWLGAIIFCVLYVVHRILSYYRKKDSKETDGSEEEGTGLMFVLAFLMPKYIVWAVCAFLLQRIICADFLREAKPKGLPAPSVTRLVIVLLLCYVYLVFMFNWWLYHTGVFHASYAWAANGLLSAFSTLESLWTDLIKGIFAFGFYGAIYLAVMPLIKTGDKMDQYFQAYLTQPNMTDEQKDKVGDLVMSALGWSLIFLLSTLLPLWICAVNIESGISLFMFLDS